ncbi:MAG: hypothetical protein KF819_32815 [Labilithrix sp.]|nr:hypothetical protein [Labilithrix sp.]
MRLAQGGVVVFALLVGCGPSLPRETMFAKGVANPEIPTNPKEMPTSTDPRALPDVIDLLRDRPSTEDKFGNRYLIAFYAQNRICFYSSQFKDGVERYASNQKTFELVVADDDAQLASGSAPRFTAELKVLGDLPNVQSKGARLYLCYQSDAPLVTARTKWLGLRVVASGETKPWDDARVFFQLTDVEAAKAEDQKNAPPGRVVRKRSF